MLTATIVACGPLVASVASEGDKSAAAATSQPASRPASEIVLVRVGPSAITQEDFNNRTIGEKLENIKRYKSTILKRMVGERMLLLYLHDHPDVVDKAKIDAAIEDVIKKEGVKNREELDAKLKAEGRQAQLKAYLEMKLIILGRGAMMAKGEKRANDDAELKKVFDENPEHFDGTRVRVRHILMMTAPWDSPETLKTKREKLERIRQDVLAGRRTWEECVQESDDVSTKMIGGDLGFVPRHLEKQEALAKVAFETKKGEMSEVFETPIGFELIQVTDVHKGQLKFEDAKVWVKLFLMQEPVLEADRQAHLDYPVVGVKEPDLPPYRPPATLPAAASHPAVVNPKYPMPPGRHSTSRPAMNQYRPTSRPAVGKARPAPKPVAQPHK